MVLLSPFSSSVEFPLLHQSVQKVNQFNCSLSSQVTFEDLVFTFEEVSISVLRDKGCDYQRTPYHSSPVQEAGLVPVLSCGWICSLQWRPLRECWPRLESPRDAAHPFAEVAAHFWKQCYHACSLLALSWWTCLCNTNGRLVHAEERAFSCYSETVGKKIHPFSSKDVAEYHHSPLRVPAAHLQPTFSVSKKECCKFKLYSLPDITLIRPCKNQDLWRHLTSCLSRGWQREWPTHERSNSCLSRCSEAVVMQQANNTRDSGTSCHRFVLGHGVILRCYARWCIRQIIWRDWSSHAESFWRKADGDKPICCVHTVHPFHNFSQSWPFCARVECDHSCHSSTLRLWHLCL